METAAQKQNIDPNYAELLEREYGMFPLALQLIQSCRADGMSDKEIFENLESFF